MTTNLDFIKAIVKILRQFLITLVVLLLLAIVALQFGKTQLFVVNKVFDYLETKYQVTFQVERVKINPFGSFKIKDVLIKDHHQDTLIYVQDLKGRILSWYGFKNKHLFFRNIYAKNGILNDFTYANEDTGSLKVFTDKFKTDKKNSKPLVFSFTNLHPEKLRYIKHSSEHKVVDFKDISGEINKLKVNGAQVELLTDSLSFKDVYDINYQKLKTTFNYSLSQMSFENTQIVTDHSNILADLQFDYETGDFANFVDKVKLKGNIDQSKIGIEDLNKIYPHFLGKQVFNLKSNVTGTLNNLTLKNTELISTDHLAYLIGDFSLENSIKNREQFKFSALKSSIEIRPNLLTDIVPNQYHSSLPNNYYGVNQINYIGDVLVSKSKLDLDGEIISNLGQANVKGFLDAMNTDTKKVNLTITNGLVSKGVLYKELNKTAFEGSFEGTIASKKINALGQVNFKQIQFKNNTIKNSNLKVQFTDKLITSTFQSRDSLLSLYAKANYSTKGNKKEYNLFFDFKKLKVAKLFPEQVSFQKNIVASGKVKIAQENSNVIAQGIVDKLQIDTDVETVYHNKINFYLSSSKEKKKIKLASKDLLDLEVDGDFEFTDLKKLTENALYKFIPGKKDRNEVKNQTLDFDLNVYPKFAKSITNSVELDNSLTVSGTLDAKEDKGIIRANIPSISSDNFKIDTLKVVLDNSNHWINTNISIDKFQFKKQMYRNLSLLGKKVDDTLFVRSNFNSDKINNRAIFYLTKQEHTISLGIEDLYFKYLNSIWVNNKDRLNKVDYNYKTGDWKFYEVSFANNEQEFDFDGAIKKNKSKDLKLALKNINLAEVMPSVDSLSVAGIASGSVLFKEQKNLLKPMGNLYIENLDINGVSYGNMATSIKPNGDPQGYDVDFKIYNKLVQNIDAHGEITIDKKNFLSSKVNLDLALKDLKLNSLSPLGRNVLSSIRGEAEGSINIQGKLNDFNSFGYINLKNSGLKFPYLNTDYNFIGDTKIEVKGKSFLFNKILLQDEEYKTNGILSGEINYNKSKDWFLDLKIDSENLLVLNTQQDENSSYYGTAFMRGNASIKGVTSALDINVTGRTLPNTTFVLPLSDVKKAEKNKFIFYKEHTTEEKQEKNIEEQTNDQGLNISLNIGVTKDAFGQIVIDQNSGSSLQARADGRLLINIDNFLNIKMYGDLVLDEGMYIYKYGKIINKPFTVKKGSTVSWSGDPYEANLNIEAIHSVKANPKVLLESLSTNRKIDVNLITKVSGELFDSSQEFIIEIPNASSTVSSELDFKLNTDENSKMRQFFSLLVSKSFYDENNTTSTGSVLSNTTSELISNAVTEIFNNKDNKLQVNIGYTAGEESDVEDLTIDDQIDIGLETEINDRILINGKLGVPVGANAQSTVIGEVKIEFLINKEGTLRSSVFNRQNEIQYSEEEQGYTQGVGLSYQIDFNNLREMLQKIELKNKKEKKNKNNSKHEISE